MTTVYFILTLLWFAGLIVVTALAPRQARLSSFELSRRKDAGDDAAVLDVRRESLYQDIVSVQRALQSIFLVAFVLSAVGAFGWFLGALLSVVVSLEYGRIAATGIVRRQTAALYDRHEQHVLSYVERYQSFISWLRSAVPRQESVPVQSRQEFEHVVTQSQGVLTSDEKKLLLASLHFEDRKVHEIMTPKSVIDTIGRTEVLGPLVLDDLHKTGHSRFPVVDGDIDHVVGILYVHDVLTLDTSRKHTAKVESAMSSRVFYIREDHSLKQALSAFLSTHHHMFIVINEYRETVGLITLEDTLEALLGRKIIDEFDAHDDMRQVAARNANAPTAPNRSSNGKDI